MAPVSKQYIRKVFKVKRHIHKAGAFITQNMVSLVDVSQSSDINEHHRHLLGFRTENGHLGHFWWENDITNSITDNSYHTLQ